MYSFVRGFRWRKAFSLNTSVPRGMTMLQWITKQIVTYIKNYNNLHSKYNKQNLCWNEILELCTSITKWNLKQRYRVSYLYKNWYLVSWRKNVIRWMQVIWDNDVSKSCLTLSIRRDTFSNSSHKIKCEISPL